MKRKKLVLCYEDEVKFLTKDGYIISGTIEAVGNKYIQIFCEFGYHHKVSIEKIKEKIK